MAHVVFSSVGRDNIEGEASIISAVQLREKENIDTLENCQMLLTVIVIVNKNQLI